VSQGWWRRQIDVQNAVLHGHLEEVSMQLPLNFEGVSKLGYVCKLDKAICMG
jgi:hypothetical protein